MLSRISLSSSILILKNVSSLLLNICCSNKLKQTNIYFYTDTNTPTFGDITFNFSSLFFTVYKISRVRDPKILRSTSVNG